jgi:hypothetical protein
MLPYFAKRKERAYLEGKTFTFDGKALPYFCHSYNWPASNERCIEVPIVMSYFPKAKEILEVGRVLPHYYPEHKHDVVDKFEAGAINVDVVDYKTDKKYQLVATISTLEHVGWDEARNPGKIFTAIRNLRGLLAPGGTLVATVPTGYNHDLTAYLEKGGKLFEKEWYFVKMGDGSWAQTEELLHPPYDFQRGRARALVVGTSGPL